MTTSTRTAVLALAMLALAAAAALPAPAEAAPQWSVRISDLDVNSSAGIHELYDRIQFAAKQVCGQLTPHTIGWLVVYDKCRNAAVARAVADAKLAALTEYNSQRNRSRNLLARR